MAKNDPFSDRSKNVAIWQPILGSKWVKSADSFSFLAFRNGSKYRNSDFKNFSVND